MAESEDRDEMDSNEENIRKSFVEDTIDEKKVETAIKFLQNPNVRKTTFSNRVAFLKRKGLSQKEIDIAIDRSGTHGDKDMNIKQDHNLNPQQQQGMLGTPLPAAVIQSKPRSFGSHVSSVVIGGGIIYAAVYVLKNYIIPYFIGEEHDEIRVLEKSIKDLNSGISELNLLMKNTIQNIEVKLENQQDILSQVSSELDITKRKLEVIPSDVTSLSDVKAEIASVKGLLLGRNQFPPTPFASTSPSIPAWQKASAKKKQADRQLAEDTTVDVRLNQKEDTSDDSSQDIVKDTMKSQITEFCDARKGNDSGGSDDSDDREVTQLTEYASKSFSDSYIKVQDDL